MRKLNNVSVMLIFLFVGASAQDINAQYQIKRSVIGGGAGYISSTNHSIQSTLGQPAIGIMTSSNHSIYTGFWYGSNTYLSIPDMLDEFIPQKFQLFQNYPNPFNPVTHIRYGFPKTSDVRIEIFNILGQRVSTLINARKTAGYHSVDFDGSQLSSGVYIYRIQAGDFIETKKMVLMK